MPERRFWIAAGCLTIATLLGTLLTDPVRTLPLLRDSAPELLAVVEPQIEAVTESSPAAALEPNPDRARITAEAEALIQQELARAWPEIDTTAWSEHYVPDADFLIDGAHGNKWITVTSARVPCEDVDRVLAELNDPNVGMPNRCDRWLAAAAQVMEAHQIKERTPWELLEELDADRSIRVMLVYAGWFKDPEQDGVIHLVDSRTVPLYPASQFIQQKDQAQIALLLAMKLGPYAETLPNPDL